MKTIITAADIINEPFTAKTAPTTRRSAWGRGVCEYAAEIAESLTGSEESPRDVMHSLLNGASDWHQYSEGGSSLIYDAQIADRLCNPTEYKRTRGGLRAPNRRESWLDVQARALYQAAGVVCSIWQQIHDRREAEQAADQTAAD